MKPELLAPAGDMERLHMAVLYGADAVYLAGTDFGMRAFAGNFEPDELRRADRDLRHSRLRWNRSSCEVLRQLLYRRQSSFYPAAAPARSGVL